MATAYATDHASALADIRAAGADVTFRKVTTTRSETTGLVLSTATETVTGAAIQTKGVARMYEALGLVQHEAPTLLFCPDTMGSKPSLGSTVTWGGVSYAVKAVDPVAPAGTSVVSRIVIAR